MVHHTQKRNGFTLLEVLLVVGIISLLLSFAVIRLKPFQRKMEAFNIKREADMRSLQHGVTAYSLDALGFPPGMPVGTASVAKPVCRETVSGANCTGSSVNGIDLSSLVPEYLSGIPIDPAMTGSILTGYKLYSDGDDVYVVAPLFDTLPSATTGSSTSSEPAGPAVAHWTFNDATGTTAADNSGNNQNGTLLNGATWTTGLLGGGLQFDGSNDEVTVADHASLDGFSAFTLSTWIRPFSWKDAHIAGISDAYTLSLTSDGHIQYAVQPLLTVTTSQSIAPVNQWTHVALVYNGSAVTLYINGVPDKTTNATGTVAVTSSPFRIGASSYFQGVIDDVRLNRVALTATDVGSLASAGFAGSQLAYWPFNDGTGTSAADASGNGRTANLINGPLWTGTSTPPTTYSNSHSLQLDGTDDYVRVPYHASLDFKNKPAFSVSLWAYLSSSMSRGGLVGMISPGGQGWQVFGYTNSAYFMINNNPQISGVISASGWHHLTGVWDGQTMTLYIDGTLAASQPTTTSPANSAYDVLMGGLSYDGATAGNTPFNLFNNKIDDVRLFNRPLSSAEARALAAGNALP